MPPINCTSKCRMLSLRRDISRQTANASGKNIVKGFTGSQALLEGLRFVGQGVIGQRSQLRFQAVDALDDRHQGLDFTVVLAAENEIQKLCQHRAFGIAPDLCYGEDAGVTATQFRQYTGNIF